MEAFWTTEYGQNLLSVEQTEIDKLLSQPNSTTLEDLFDEDELLQQCSNKNTQLINFLSKQENITKLVSYITRPWQEHMNAIINHLQERENEQKNQPQNDTDSLQKSPLSKNGTNRINSIEEEPSPMDINTYTANNNNDAQPEIATDNTIQNQANNKSEIFAQIIDDNIPSNDTNQVVQINEETKEQNDNDNDNDNDNNIADEDEFNDKNYDNLKLSDDENENENKNINDDIQTDIISPTNDTEPPPPKLKKKGSIVDMLMSGPEFDDDTELDSEKISPNDADADADPELPDLDVKKENETDAVASPNGNTETETDNEIPSPTQPLIFDSERDDIPPPPPPPTQPSKLDEFKSDIGTEKVKLKYPYLSSEIINCQIPQILDTILSEDLPFLDMLFDFICQSPPLNAVLTNYWRSAIVGLVRRNSNVILKYIKSRKNLLSSLVQHIRDQSIMELVIALGWDPAIEELKELDEVADWMYQQELVPKLIDTLSPNRTPDEHSAASYTLVDIVAKTSRSTNLVLFYNLASEKQIDALMNHMFAGNRSSLLESLSVLLALLHHYPNVSAEKQQFGEEENENDMPQQQPQQNDIPPPPPPQPQETFTQNQNPLAPSQSQSIEQNNANGVVQNINPLAQVAATDMDTVQLPSSDCVVKTSVEKPQVTQTESKDETENEQNVSENENNSEKIPGTGTGTQELKFNESIPSVVKAVCLRLSEFKVLLEDDNLPDLELPFVHLSPPLGPVRHKVVDMIVALMRTPSTVVSQKLRSLGLIVKCIDLFFLYPWNNLLHGSVEHIIQMVVSGECSVLKAALFEDCDFLNRILKARQLSTEHQEKSGFRLGYMGHITRVSNTIVEFAKRNQQLLEYMQMNADWMKFIADDLKLENEQLNTQLGGHRPNALGADDDVDDFTLFTLNDITNHNDDPEQILNDQHNDEEDEDNDSDSDSDEDIQNSNTNPTNYETPQDAFTKLTQKIDENNDSDEHKQNINDSTANTNQNNTVTNDEFDSWLNDEENWNDFGDDKNNNNKNNNNKNNKPALNMSTIPNNNNNENQNQTEINGDVNVNVNVNNKKEDETLTQLQQENKGKEKDEFDNWDNDPFANDDLFANDDNENNNDKLNNGHINNKIEQQQTVVAVND